MTPIILEWGENKAPDGMDVQMAMSGPSKMKGLWSYAVAHVKGDRWAVFLCVGGGVVWHFESSTETEAKNIAQRHNDYILQTLEDRLNSSDSDQGGGSILSSLLYDPTPPDSIFNVK